MAKKIIKISESQCKRLFCEDVEFTRGNNGSVNVTIGKRGREDKYNAGGNNVDTRIFGSQSDILYGDGTRGHNNLADLVLSAKAAILTWKNVISYIKNGKKGNIFVDKNISPITKKAIERALNSGEPDEEIIRHAMDSINRIKADSAQNTELYNRVYNSDIEKDGDRIARYTKFLIPTTNVYCIALFHMGTFDLSDAIKKGGLRSTSALFNGNLEGYNVNSDGRVPVTYDGNKTPNISQNFSLNGLDNLNKGSNRDHFKNVQQYQDASNYTSINQFLDKSIMYASYVLKKEDFIPDYIVSAPSSSKMNDYYSTNLSNKLGCTYINDFFKRNIIYAHVKDNMTDDELRKNGFSTYDIESLRNGIKSYCYGEITYMIEEPLRNFLDKNMDFFSNISIEKGSRQKADYKTILRIMSKYAFKSVYEYTPSNEYVGKTLCYNFLKKKDYTNDSYILHQIIFIISSRMQKEFRMILNEMFKLVNYYTNEVKRGYHPATYGVDKSKITKVDKKYRNYIEGSYIIADSDYAKNGELFERVKNGKFLIVDEDVNSGGTFKLTIEALQEKLNQANGNNIMCLANGFSNSGR